MDGLLRLAEIAQADRSALCSINPEAISFRGSPTILMLSCPADEGICCVHVHVSHGYFRGAQHCAFRKVKMLAKQAVKQHDISEVATQGTIMSTSKVKTIYIKWILLVYQLVQLWCRSNDFDLPSNKRRVVHINECSG